jgi:hypothetical protein
MLTINDNASDSPQTIALRGYGTFFQVSPTVRHFAVQRVGTTSSPLTVTLTNFSSTTSQSVSVQIVGRSAADFAETSACGSTLEAQASCVISITFTPITAGSMTATMEVIGGGGGTRTVQLGGVGQ